MEQQKYKQAHKAPKKVKKRRSPVPVLLVFAVVVFAAGFLSGFLTGVLGRDFVVSAVLEQFQPETTPTIVIQQTQPEETEPPETTQAPPVVTAPPEPTEPQETTTEPAVDCPIDLDDWRLTLVNPWNEVPEGYMEGLELADTINGQQVDIRILTDLNEMIDALYIAGLKPAICSGYRSVERQTTLYENKVTTLMASGMTEEEARVEAATVVAVPGTSEHHLGLAIDVVDNSNWSLDESQEGTAVQQWMMEHSWEYGFILRYPNGKTDITGIIYEPWHYRYVGKEVAAQIHELGVTFEEYLELIGA